MAVGGTGEVDFPQMARSIGASGHCKPPGGLIMQWGTATTNSRNSDNRFPLPFQMRLFQLFVIEMERHQHRQQRWAQVPRAQANSRRNSTAIAVSFGTGSPSVTKGAKMSVSIKSDPSGTSRSVRFYQVRCLSVLNIIGSSYRPPWLKFQCI